MSNTKDFTYEVVLRVTLHERFNPDMPSLNPSVFANEIAAQAQKLDDDIDVAVIDVVRTT